VYTGADTRPTGRVHAWAAIVTSLVKLDSWYTHTLARRRTRRKKTQLTRDGNYSTVNAQMRT